MAVLMNINLVDTAVLTNWKVLYEILQYSSAWL